MVDLPTFCPIKIVTIPFHTWILWESYYIIFWIHVISKSKANFKEHAWEKNVFPMGCLPLKTSFFNHPAQKNTENNENTG